MIAVRSLAGGGDECARLGSGGRRPRVGNASWNFGVAHRHCGVFERGTAEINAPEGQKKGSENDEPDQTEVEERAGLRPQNHVQVAARCYHRPGL